MIDAKPDQVVAILAAARRCYLANGIAATGMKEVAASAELARSTLYRYFWVVTTYWWRPLLRR